MLPVSIPFPSDWVITPSLSYDLKYAASAAFRMENTLLVKIQIIDSAIGNLFFSLNFKGDYVTVMLRKIEESLFGEYNGVFSGRKI